MLTLYCYPTLFGVADNNGYGLKVYAFLRLVGLPFRHEHVFDASKTGNNVVGWSPYDGMTLPYKVAGTYLRGVLVYDGSKVFSEPGSGRFVRPPASLLLQDRAV